MYREFRCVTIFVVYCSSFVVSWDATKLSQNKDSSNNACDFCVGDECRSVPYEKCLYFSKTSAVIGRDNCAVFGVDASEGPKDGAKEADHALFEIVSEALTISENAQCLPLISEYTDCQKDNICTGCKECTCSESGHWTCTLVQRCTPSTKIRVTHKLLALMMATLLDQGYKNGSANETALSNPVDIFQDLIVNKLVNVKKREINNEKPKNDTSADKKYTEDLKINALVPLNKVIAQKYNELNNLRYIENYLIRYLISEGAINATYALNDSENFAQSNESPNFVIYKFETASELEPKIARSETNILTKLTKRILQGISQIATDIGYYEKAIYKHDKSKLPEDLKRVMNMLKHYVNKQKKNKKSSKRTYEKHDNTFTNDTNFLNTTNMARKNSLYIENSLTDILKNINSSKLSDDVNLSKHGHKVFERIAKHAFFKHHTLDVPFKKERDLHYMDQLRNIGHDWTTLSTEVVKSNINSVQDYLKLIHLSVSADANTMHDILTKINNEKIISNEALFLVNKINSSLVILRAAIENVSTASKQLCKTKVQTTTQKFTSAISQPPISEHSIKEVLKKSRNDIFTILKNKFKHDLPRGLVHNHFDNYNKDKYKKLKSLMLQWQKKLNVQPRPKRSAAIHSKLRRIRLRNILPKYLRKKVSPAINERKLRNITANQNIDLNNAVYVF